jgi:putative transposase
LIEADHRGISIQCQCDLVGLARSSYYYELRGESELSLLLMNLLDEQYMKTPFYGVPRMTRWLVRKGYLVNEKRIARLMRLMGLAAIYPKRGLSRGDKAHKIFPYLLKGLSIDRPDQVWCSDITYVRLEHGFLYLVAVMDWFSRYVLSWGLSNTLEKDFCLEALEEALVISQPEIFNTDQGSQFTSPEFTSRLLERGIAVSMDSRGRVFDNIFIERLWRTVKYEEIYLTHYQNAREARAGLKNYFAFYNTERSHSSLEYLTPAEAYAQQRVQALLECTLT